MTDPSLLALQQKIPQMRIDALSKAEQARWMNGIEKVMLHEGGYADDPADAGGETNWGISLRFLQGLDLREADIDRDGDIDADDIRDLTAGQAAELYFLHFWRPHRYGDLPDGIAEKVFDLSVNMGPRQAHKLLQRALRSCRRQVADDGVLGPITRGAVLAVPPGALAAALRSEAAGFYRALIARNARLARFERGWLKRAYS